MKKAVLIVFIAIGVVYLTGCGKKEPDIQELQEPMSMEELSALSANMNMTVNEQVNPIVPMPPAVAPKPQTELPLEPLPPSGPYKPTPRDIQTALKNSGFYKGNVDGKIGPMSKRAIEEFQRANGLEVDGKVGLKTWAALSKHLTSSLSAPTGQPR